MEKLASSEPALPAEPPGAASPDPRRPQGKGGRDGEGRPAGRAAGKGLAPAPGKMPQKSREQRCSPPAAGHLASPRRFRGPRGRKSRPHDSPPGPDASAAGGREWGAVGAPAAFPAAETFQHASQPVLLGETRHPGRGGTPPGAAPPPDAPRTHLPARRAPAPPAGTQTLRTAGPAPRLLPEPGSLMVRGARPPRSPRRSPVPGAAAPAAAPAQAPAAAPAAAPAPARAPAAAAAGAALSRRARPSTGDLRLRGPTPPRGSA